MIKIGITGSIASGKTTASKFISRGKGPLFSADKIVKKLYSKTFFKKLLAKKLKIEFNSEFKKIIKNKILREKEILNKIEKIIHPMVRKEMFTFLKRIKIKNFYFWKLHC